MPKCCSKIHVGWICPLCGKAIAIQPHSGNDPIPIGKLSPPQVTVVQGDYIQGSIIKDSVVMGDVPTPEKEIEDLTKTVSNEIQDIVDQIIFD